MIVPADVPREFLMRASSNTRRNVETCGILAGNLVIIHQLNSNYPHLNTYSLFHLQSQGCLKLTHIIIPKQTGTSDSCDTCNEEEIFEALDSSDLITLGWIHVSKWIYLHVCHCDPINLLFMCTVWLSSYPFA